MTQLFGHKSVRPTAPVGCAAGLDTKRGIAWRGERATEPGQRPGDDITENQNTLWVFFFFFSSKTRAAMCPGVTDSLHMAVALNLTLGSHFQMQAFSGAPLKGRQDSRRH